MVVDWTNARNRRYPGTTRICCLDALGEMAGQVVEVRVSEGASVEKGQILFLVESMKMQLEVLSPAKGRVASIVVEAGQILGGPDTLAILEMA